MVWSLVGGTLVGLFAGLELGGGDPVYPVSWFNFPLVGFYSTGKTGAGLSKYKGLKLSLHIAKPPSLLGGLESGLVALDYTNEISRNHLRDPIPLKGKWFQPGPPPCLVRLHVYLETRGCVPCILYKNHQLRAASSVAQRPQKQISNKQKTQNPHIPALH